MSRAILLSIFLSITFLCHSQIENSFFVDDVRVVEHATVNFCVDENGEIKNYKIITKKTSYENQKVINEVIMNHSKIVYTSGSKLINKCYDYTFAFVNKKYENKKLLSVDNNKCETFRKGRFRYVNNRYKNIKIKRRRNIQIEKSNKGKSKYEIEWKSPCEYSLTYLKVSSPEYDYLLGNTINVEIIDILDDNTYVYYSNLLNRSKVIGVMKKL